MCYVYVGRTWSGKTGKMFLLWNSKGKQITLCSEVTDKTGEAEIPSMTDRHNIS